MGIASSLLLLQCSGISFQIASGGKSAWRLSMFHLKFTGLRSAMASSQKSVILINDFSLFYDRFTCTAPLDKPLEGALYKYQLLLLLL